MSTPLPPQLQLMVERERIPHALLFCGPKGAGKGAAAKAFAKAIICKDQPKAAHKIESNNHGDIHHYTVEGKSGIHSIETLRRLSYEVSLCPNEANYKFFIIHDAHRMPLTSSNALLKTFEEPAPHTVILLLTSHPEHILPTVLSRCQKVPFLASKEAQRNEEANPLIPIATSLKTLSFHELVDKVALIAKESEKERKQLEKELIKQLPKELTLTQKERYHKEIEGTLTLKALEKYEQWFEGLLKWLYEHDKPLFPLAQQGVAEAKTALARSFKLASTLEAFFLRLSL